jgi:hypothetical protein
MFGLDTVLIRSKTAAISVNLGTVEKVLLAERRTLLKTINQAWRGVSSGAIWVGNVPVTVLNDV